MKNQYYLLLFFIILIKCENLTFKTNLFNNLQKLTYNKLPSLTNYIYQKKNICISPLSIYQIMSLVSNGANGKTQNEILESLISFKKNDLKVQIELNKNNLNILKLYDNYDKISIANAIMSKIKITEDFSLTCKRYNAFFSILKNVEQVNKWCEEKTKGKIKKILDNIKGIELILLNAIYFKNDWEIPFEKKATSKQNFYNENKSISKVDMMFKKFFSINYYEDDKIQMIELPYKDNDLSMIIILPSKEKFESTFDYLNKEKIDFSNLIKKLENNKIVKLNLPKFEFEYETSLKDSFMYLNMKEAFYNNADFSKISQVKKLKIDNIIHKTYIKVDEFGTEATSVTAVTMLAAGVFIDNSISMNVDHYFIFLIRDKRIKDIYGNDLMLFIGTVDNL